MFDDNSPSEPEQIAEPEPVSTDERLDSRSLILEAKLQTLEAQLLDLQTVRTHAPPIPYTAPPPNLLSGSDSLSGGDDNALHTVSSTTPVSAYLFGSTSPGPIPTLTFTEFIESLTPPKALEQAPDEISLSRLPTLHPTWPPNIPPPELLCHLAETFFAHLPHASRLLHRGTFMASLAQPPDSPEFPTSTLLHAICAAASLYTSVVKDGILPDINELPPDEILYRISARFEGKPDASFGESHAVWSSLTIFGAMERGRNLLQLVQSVIVLSWYYYTAGSLSTAWLLISKAAHLVVPLGINVAELHAPVSRFASQAPLILPPPRNDIEAEERRNLLWLIYAGERLITIQTGWLVVLDDEDVSQFLPLSDEDFSTGRTYPSESRQCLTTPGVLLLHPASLTSPFSLLIKTVRLLSRVQKFNLRSRNRYDADIDPRDTEEFAELDELVQQFRGSWPQVDAHGASDETVDPTLYLAASLASMVTIILHEPHAEISSGECPSAQKITGATADIVNLIYKLSNTSLDILLLDHFTGYCWAVAGAALISMLKVKLNAGSVVGVIKLNSDINIVIHALSRLSEKTVIGRRHLKWLNDIYENEIGRAAAEPPIHPPPI